MERNGFWIFLGIGLAVGICLEIMKAPTGKGKVRLAGFTRFETILDEGREVYIPEKKTDKVKGPAGVRKNEELIVPHQLSPEELPPSNPQTIQQTAPDTSPQSTPQMTSVPGMPAKPGVRPETPEEKKRREDAIRLAKQKADETKKQQEETTRKEEAEKAQAARDLEEREAKEKADAEEAEKKKAAEAEENQDIAVPPVVESPGNSTVNPGNKPVSASEWEAYLAKGKDLSRIQRFVKAYREGDIPPQIYYGVLRSLMKNKRPELHQHAVFALGSTPSQTSFGLLITMASADSNPGIHGQALSLVNNYAQLPNLRYLAEVLSNEHNPAVVMEALRVIKASATQYLNAAPPSGQPSAQGGGQQVNTAALVRYFNPIVAALNSLSHRSTDANVRTSAAQTLTQLQTQLAPLGHGQTQH
jgi:hypothetical protein